MIIACRLLAIVLVVALPGYSVPPRDRMLGVVTQALYANLSTGPVSAGTTVYDGDLLSTGEDGALTFRGPASLFYLGQQSRMIVRSLPEQTTGSAAHLSAGTLVFSSAHAATLEVFADDARIHPFADTPTIGQVTIIGPKMLYVHARQGSLVFSYRDENQVVAEGKSYRVLLDPDDDGSTNKPSDNQTAKKPTRRRPFAFVVVAGFFLLPAAIGAYLALESPDHP